MPANVLSLFGSLQHQRPQNNSSFQNHEHSLSVVCAQGECVCCTYCIADTSTQLHTNEFSSFSPHIQHHAQLCRFLFFFFYCLLRQLCLLHVSSHVCMFHHTAQEPITPSHALLFRYTLSQIDDVRPVPSYDSSLSISTLAHLLAPLYTSWHLFTVDSYCLPTCPKPPTNLGLHCA